MAQGNEIWIENVLVPLLVAEEKLQINEKGCNNGLPIIKNVSVKSLNTTEVFMLTMCYKVEVMLEQNGKEHNFSLVIKKTPATPDHVYEAVGFDRLFANEIIAYSMILPALGQSNRYIKYHYSNRKKGEAIIVLDDFSVQGYRMSKQRYNLSLDHILLGVKQLGEFHGRAYGMKLTKPEKFQSLVQLFHQSRFVTDPPDSWQSILDDSFKRLCKVVDESDLPKIMPVEFLNKLKNTLKDFKILTKLTSKPVEPFATICHGDYLRNNVAYKYSDKNPDQPVDIIMFDFQTIIYTTPMMDLSTFLAMSAGSELRSDNFDLIFKTYWDYLVENTSQISGIHVNNLPEFLSYNSMLEEFIKYFVYGIRIATFFLMQMVESTDLSPEEFINEDKAIDFDTFNRGGEIVNKEIRSLILKLYNLSKKHQVDIFKHFDKLENL